MAVAFQVGPPLGSRMQPRILSNYDVLVAQEDAEDRRLRERADLTDRRRGNNAPTENNETTPWLRHTRWPETFRDRPLDIITAAASLPQRFCSDEDVLLGFWHGTPIKFPAADESRLRLLMRAVDWMFDRAEATLIRTGYRHRCWISSYWENTFWTRPLPKHPEATRRRYISKWKRFLCFAFRTLRFPLPQRREIFNFTLRENETATMRQILDLLSWAEDETANRDGDESHRANHCNREDLSSPIEESNTGGGEESDESSVSSEDEELGNNNSEIERAPGLKSENGHVDDRENIREDGNGEPVFALPSGVFLQLTEAVFQL
ncbi:hypothetical protein HIM_11664 [Hirsutella minnesotensis 3608]|uniref:Uncharacterized protein n=1 Tax=Hirsutella minnesotensis 3608 TaxID=1043627 RepID=A0A0F7ZR40_9HYPO|nr:hypothetical protein HIM_11664 [Hirsutella minnesotensis 3608]